MPVCCNTVINRVSELGIYEPKKINIRVSKDATKGLQSGTAAGMVEDTG